MSGLLAHESFTELDDSLSLVKDFEEDKHLNSLGEEAVLQAKIEDDQVAEEESEAQSEGEAEEEPSEMTEDESDSGELADDDESTSDEESEVIDGKQTTVVAESLRHDLETRMVTESFQGVLNQTGQGVASIARFATKSVMAAASTLKELGIKYGPGIVDRVGRSLTYIFSRSLRLLLKTITASIDAGKRQYRSFSRSQQKIQSLQETLKTLETGEGVRTDEKTAQRLAYRDPKGLSYFRVGNKIDPMESLVAIREFMKNAITQIDRHIEQDLNAVKQLIELSQSRTKGDLLAFMRVEPFSVHYLKEELKGYQQDKELIDNYVYAKSLPNGLLFAAALPKSNLKDIEQIGRAYQEAGVFLAVDSSLAPIQQESVDYMDKQKLEEFLVSLSELCALALQHASLYGRISKKASQLKFNYRHYYQSLIESSEKISVRESLVEYVHLKQAFISRIYLPAAMDVHDYVGAYVVRALSFAQENLNHLK